MYKIKLNPALMQSVTKTSALKVSQRAGLSYPTVWKMANGQWNNESLEILAKYLWAMGVTPDVLRELKFSDVFEIDDGIAKQR